VKQNSWRLIKIGYDKISISNEREVINMKYVDTIKRELTTTVDGYSNAKTIKGALNDMGRYIEKHLNTDEGKFLQVVNKEEAEEMLSIGNHSYSDWGIEVEEVSCGCKVDEKGNIIEYCDANFYVMVRFCN